RRHRPSIVIVALGANDGLRGEKPETMRLNLEAIVRVCRSRGARVLLLGMRLPPNYGKPYTEKFHAVFGEIAGRQRVPLVPFLLEGFAENRDYFQSDGLHPTAAAQPLILETVWKKLEPMLKR
ncbi:MAG: arylesterase, partial [Betaproteobacteria bacterium]|nr:arylesterase [Betaproteobacteria bacterium]